MITDCEHEAGVCPGGQHCECGCVNCARKVVRSIVKAAVKEIKNAEKKGKRK